MKYTIEVTDEEYKTIMDLRSQKHTEHQRKALSLLNLTASYLRWLNENGAGDTYSTFCGDFGYEAGIDEDRPSTHRDVMSTIRHAHELTA
jgi:hypothetical protein